MILDGKDFQVCALHEYNISCGNSSAWGANNTPLTLFVYAATQLVVVMALTQEVVMIFIAQIAPSRHIVPLGPI